MPKQAPKKKQVKQVEIKHGDRSRILHGPFKVEKYEDYSTSYVNTEWRITAVHKDSGICSVFLDSKQETTPTVHWVGLFTLKKKEDIITIFSEDRAKESNPQPIKRVKIIFGNESKTLEGPCIMLSRLKDEQTVATIYFNRDWRVTVEHKGSSVSSVVIKEKKNGTASPVKNWVGLFTMKKNKGVVTIDESSVTKKTKKSKKEESSTETKKKGSSETRNAIESESEKEKSSKNKNKSPNNNKKGVSSETKSTKKEGKKKKKNANKNNS